MKTIGLKRPVDPGMEILKVVMLFVVLSLLWPSTQGMIQRLDITAGYVDPSILVLVVLSLLCFLGMIGLSWWLVKRFWMALDRKSVV